jgi:hypothetical protein
LKLRAAEAADRHTNLSSVVASQSGDNLQEGLAKFGYKLNMKVKFVTNPSFFGLGTY